MPIFLNLIKMLAIIIGSSLLVTWVIVKLVYKFCINKKSKPKITKLNDYKDDIVSLEDNDLELECEYCGTIYKNKNNKCPNCGAQNKL